MTNVLIVEDERLVSQALGSYVKSAPDRYKLVRIIKNADDAELVLLKEKIDLIVMDICTMYSNGLTVAKKLKQKYPKIKIISVGDHAFDGCTSLKDVYYPGTEDMWKQIDIDICNDALTNATIHWHVHSYNSSEVTKPATCVENGIMTITCTGCGDTQTVVIPSAHTPEVIPAVPATCTSTGLTEGSKCAVCGIVFKSQETVEMVAHTPEVVPAVAPTCTKTGLTEGSKCAVCGIVFKSQETVEMVDHTPEVIPAVPATCTSTGLTEGSKCAVCGEILTAQETVAKLAHTPLISPAIPASCTSTGLSAGSKCAVCGETIVEQTTIPMIAHTPMVIPAVSATTESTGLTEGSKCSVCGTILVEQKVVDKLPVKRYN